jgi:hypothetical protein
VCACVCLGCLCVSTCPFDSLSDVSTLVQTPLQGQLEMAQDGSLVET